MSQAGVDALICVCDENFAYYSGFRRTFVSPLNWFQTLIVAADGHVVAVVPDHNVNIVTGTCWVDDVRPWGGPDDKGLPRDPVQVLVGAVKDLVGSGRRIGLELGPGMPWQATVREIDATRDGLRDFEVVDVTSHIWRQRQIKTEYEISLLREAGRIACKGFLAGLQALRAGVTERDILKIIVSTYVMEGAVDSPVQGQHMMRSGPDRYAMFSARPVDRVLQDGDQLMIDSGAVVKGYMVDMQRQACIGEPSDLQRRLYDRGLAGFQAALAAIRPGARVADVHRAAVDAMVATGVPFETHIEFFGHGIGLANHEPPWLRNEGADVIDENMVLSVEIPSYDIPQFRVLGGFLEDAVVVTRDGCENLTDAVPHDLWIAQP